MFTITVLGSFSNYILLLYIYNNIYYNFIYTIEKIKILEKNYSS